MRPLLLLGTLVALTSEPATAKDDLIESATFRAVALGHILVRDSGRPIDRAFLASCVRERTATYLRLACDDLVSEYHAALLRTAGPEPLLLILGDGASVERRYAFRLYA